MSIRLLHVSDRASGFAADTLRALAADGLDVLSLDIRAFATQKIYDPEGFSTFDRLGWLQAHEPEALARLQWADVLFVESGGFALSWITRARLGKPVVARLGREDCEGPALAMVDWAVVSHVLFPDRGGHAAFKALATGLLEPTVLNGLQTSIAPLHLASTRFELTRLEPLRSASEDGVARDGCRRSLVIAGDISRDAGAATALRIRRRLADHGVQLDVTTGHETSGSSEIARRRKALVQTAGQSLRLGATPPGELSAQARGPDYVLCASSGLEASFTTAVHAARGAVALLRRGVTAIEEWLGPAALIYENTDQAIALILREQDPAPAADDLRARCGREALAVLAPLLRRAAATPGQIV